MKTYILHELVPVSYSEVKSKGLCWRGMFILQGDRLLQLNILQ